tara:strand:+ start:124 stop:453 length:330 start_codon:yes stop_codon:yes gene_type:complete
MRTVQQVADEVVETALHYLADTDVEFGRMTGYMKFGKYWLSVVESDAIKFCTDGTQLQRKADALTSSLYRNFLTEITKKSEELCEMQFKRETAQREIDIWRTISANQRK